MSKKCFYYCLLYFQDVGNDEARPSQQAAALFIKQEKDMIQKQIFLPYPVPGNDAVPPPGIDAVPPPSIDALPPPVFHLPPGVIVPTLDGPSYTDITRSSSIYRENSFNVYDDMVQTYENTTQESESSQVTNHSQVSTASSSNWEDDMQQLIEEIVCYFDFLFPLSILDVNIALAFSLNISC